MHNFPQQVPPNPHACACLPSIYTYTIYDHKTFPQTATAQQHSKCVNQYADGIEELRGKYKEKIKNIHVSE